MKYQPNHFYIDGKNYTPLKLKKIIKDEGIFHNFIVCKSRQISVEINKRILFFKLTTASPKSKDFAEIWIKMLIDQHFFWVGFSKYSFGILLGNCFLFDSLKDLPMEIRTAIVESTLDEILNIIEHSTNSRVEVDTVTLLAPETGNTRNVFFTLNQNGASKTNGYFDFDKTLEPFFEKTLEKLPTSKFHKWNYLQTSIYFQIGSTQLKIEDLQNLNFNDLIFIDNCSLLHDHSMIIHVVPNLECKGTIKDNKILVRTAMTKIIREQNSNVVDIDELLINLVFDVGEQSIQFQELKKIHPGYIFELDNLLVSPVTIRANGQPIGRGELLQIDEKIAVRLLELNQQSDG